MKKSKFLYSLPFKLLVSVALGMGFGLLLNFNSESAFTTAVLSVIEKDIADVKEYIMADAKEINKKI